MFDSLKSVLLQNVLGPYKDYQTVVKAMDPNEQMKYYGVAELNPVLTVRSAPTEGGPSKGNHIVPPPPSRVYKKERPKKKHRDLKETGGLGHEELNGSLQESTTTTSKTKKKKGSIHPYKVYPAPQEKNPTPSSSTTEINSSQTSAHTVSNSQDIALAVKQKKPKKIKKKKGSPLQVISSGLNQVEELVKHSPQPIKQRPGALCLSRTEPSSTPPSYGDVPDTGDVQHMLQELLHPPPLSLVTPIPTPNKTRPFVFPNSHSSVVSETSPYYHLILIL